MIEQITVDQFSRRKFFATEFTRYSVVLPTYNSERTVRAAIDSVLAQTVPAGEIIVVDDASTDGTVDMVRGISSDVDILIVRKSENSGPAISRNIGIDSSRYSIIAFIDSDDSWVPTKMDRCLDAMANSSFGLVGHRYTENQVDVSNASSISGAYELGIGRMLLRNHVQTSCLVFDKKAINLRFPVHMRYCEDYAAILKCMISEAAKLSFVDEVLTLLGRPQLSPGGLSANRLAMRRGELEAYHYSTRSSRYAFLYPLLLALSFAKHLRKLLLK